MDDGSSLIGALIVFAAFILVNGSLYGFGAAIQKVSEADVEKKAGEQNDKKSQWILEIMANPATIINTILTTATLLSINRLHWDSFHNPLCLHMDRRTCRSSSY